MDDWYEQLVEGQGKVHDRICSDSEACSDRENHIENAYIPIALKTLVEHMKKERAAELRKAHAEGLREAALIAQSQAEEQWRRDRGEGMPGGVSIPCAQPVAQQLDMLAKIIKNRAHQQEQGK